MRLEIPTVDLSLLSTDGVRLLRQQGDETGLLSFQKLSRKHVVLRIQAIFNKRLDKVRNDTRRITNQHSK